MRWPKVVVKLKTVCIIYLIFEGTQVDKLSNSIKENFVYSLHMIKLNGILYCATARNTSFMTFRGPLHVVSNGSMSISITGYCVILQQNMPLNLLLILEMAVEIYCLVDGKYNNSCANVCKIFQRIHYWHTSLWLSNLQQLLNLNITCGTCQCPTC